MTSEVSATGLKTFQTFVVLPIATGTIMDSFHAFGTLLCCKETSKIGLAVEQLSCSEQHFNNLTVIPSGLGLLLTVISLKY